MAKIIDNLKEELMENILTETEIDAIMERKKYYPIESDTELYDAGILKYSNNKSEIWVKYIYSDGEYLVLDATMKTKKRGKTKVQPLRDVNDIKKLMDYFRERKEYDNFMIMMLEMLLGRRIGDTLSLKFEDFYYENGRKKSSLRTLVEQKTDKIIEISICEVVGKYLDWYCGVTNVDPILHLKEDIFKCKQKDELGNNYTEDEYYKAISKQAAAFRYDLKQASEYCKIENISTHSLRQSFGYITHSINQFDPDCLPVLQTIYGHDSIETTKRYIGIMDEKAQKYFNDVGKFIYDIDNGITPCVDNIPVVALKTNDLRDILLKAYNYGMKYSSIQDTNFHMEFMNRLISDVEKMRIQ